MLIRNFRTRGHLVAKLDPLELVYPQASIPSSGRETYGFTKADYDRQIYLGGALGLEFGTLRQVLDILKRSYCEHIGIEYMHISDPEQRAWIQERIELAENAVRFTPQGKKAILKKLIEAEIFERFLDVKYTGTKRFGLDGGESVVPALEQVIKRGGQLGLKEIVIGMPHRGRLNVLANVMAQALPGDLQRVQRRLGSSRRGRGLRRREISSRRLVGPRVRHEPRASVAHRQPVASRDRRSRRARQGAGEAGSAARQASGEKCCRCSCTAMPPSPARAWWRNASACQACAATAPAARCISSSTIRSASPRRRASRAPRPTRPTSPR